MYKLKEQINRNPELSLFDWVVSIFTLFLSVCLGFMFHFVCLSVRFRIFVSFLSINIFVNQLDSRQEIVLFVNCCPHVKSLETDITIFSDREKQLKK
jgi:hypothetical protein